ncbi:TadE/TadG family type IV pilus assembly protein [Thalassoglobus sp.]|uniref:TadE/TadG family type IV pilus assembly protein n=1 Tax=Thalassoglobus sp. TaxID=2795869 RepID=UPI003AA822B0
MRKCIRRDLYVSGIKDRSGVAVLWFIGLLPVLVVMFGVMVDTTRLWTGRVELKNAIEAAALSGVQTWGTGANSAVGRASTRDDSLTTGAANLIVGQDAMNPYDATPVILLRNENIGGGDVNDNDDLDGELILGTVSVDGNNEFIFCSNTSPGVGQAHAIRVQKTATINSAWAELFGANVGPYSIRASTVAAYFDGQPRIVHVTTYSDSCP